MDFVKGLYADMECLVAMWFAKAEGETHKERLDAFYGRQAHAYDRFRANFLHGRRPMLKELARQLASQEGPLVWVDLGGGTGENVAMMSDYMDLSKFDKIYVVDLCSPLCGVARAKAAQNGWSNVEVVEGDACTFQPEKKATVVTFSYSLSMIPPYMDAVDNALSMLSPGGLLGVADFYVSGKYDCPERQHPYYRRWFWQAVFDLDNINLGPERRAYLDHKLETVVEKNSQGGIPYVPFLRAPWYFWIGSRKGISQNGQQE